MNTKDLINDCKKNDYDSQILVYERYKDVLFNISWRIVKSDADAQDIVHDTFIKGFKNIQQLKGDMNFGAWLKRIAVNASLDFLKKKKTVNWINDIESNNEEVLLEEINPSSVTITQIMECINMLKEKYRVIVILYLIEDYTHKEIAQFLAINESTVRNQYARGRSQLKELIQLKLKE